MENIFTKINEKLGKLRRNETQMTDEQRIEFAGRLRALKIKIAEDARKICRSYLISGITLLKEDAKEVKEAISRIEMIMAEENARGTFKKASRILFSTYSVDKFLDSLCQVHDRIECEGYGPYWAKHCRPCEGGDSDEKFSFWNDIIEMGWVEEWQCWKKKGEPCVTTMLPPTMELILEEYEDRRRHYAGEV